MIKLDDIILNKTDLLLNLSEINFYTSSIADHTDHSYYSLEGINKQITNAVFHPMSEWYPLDIELTVSNSKYIEEANKTRLEELNHYGINTLNINNYEYATIFAIVSAPNNCILAKIFRLFRVKKPIEVIPLPV